MQRKTLGIACAAGMIWMSGLALGNPPARPEGAAAPHTAVVSEGHGETAKKDLVGEEVKPGPLVVAIAIFLVLLVVLSKTAWKPIMTGLQSREKAIRDSIEAAKKAQEAADRTTKELEAKMSEVQRQAAAQLTQAKADAQRIADSIRAQAETESAALKERTLREITAAKQQAVTEINSHAAELGTAVARKILQRNVTADDQQRLVEESLREMTKTNEITRVKRCAMAENEFQVESMGEIYAQALIGEAQKQNALDEVTEDVRGIGQLLQENKAFLAFTQAPIGEEEQVAALEKIFNGRVHVLTLNAIKSMARRNRIMFLRGLVEAFTAILRKMRGQVDVEVSSAYDIRPEVLERVKQAISKSESMIANLKVTIDPKLIGGMTVRIGDTLIDGSVATQLQKMETQIKRGGRVNLESVVS